LADYLKIPEVARRLDVSEPTVRRMVKGGKLPSVFVGGAYRVSEADLEEFLENAKVEPGKAQAPPSPEQPSLNGLLEEERRDAETAEKLLRFGGRMVAGWESELPERLEVEDEQWLRHTWAMYHEYIDILNSLRPGESSTRQELLAALMDINAAANRILGMVEQHNERSLEAGKKILVLEETA
jgi:excisionase family DNA binding protein